MFKQIPDDIELEILSKIAHDVNNLAGIVLLNVELLEAHATGDKVPIYLDKLRAVSSRMRQLSSHLNRRGLKTSHDCLWQPMPLIRETIADFEVPLPELIVVESLPSEALHTTVNPWLLKNLLVFGFREVCHHHPRGPVQLQLSHETETLRIHWHAEQPERAPVRLASPGAFMSTLAELMNLEFGAETTENLHIHLGVPLQSAS